MIANSLVSFPKGAIVESKLLSKVPMPTPPKPYARKTQNSDGSLKRKKIEEMINIERPMANMEAI